MSNIPFTLRCKLINEFLSEGTNLDRKVKLITTDYKSNPLTYKECLDRTKIIIYTAQQNIFRDEVEQEYESCSMWRNFLLSFCSALPYVMDHYFPALQEKREAKPLPPTGQ